MAKKHVPTDELKLTVGFLSINGVTQPRIAAILGITWKTLVKHYKFELENALDEKNAMVAGGLFAKAIAGDTTAMIFWLKTRAGWKETNVQEFAVPVMKLVRGTAKSDKSSK